MKDDLWALRATTRGGRGLAVGLVLLFAVAACAHQARPSSGAGEGDATVTGTVSYRERVALPADAVVEISIVDASVADSATKVIASATVASEGRQVPLPFVVSYDSHRIEQRHLYVIRANIHGGEQLLFASDVIRGVITQGNPTHVDLALSRVDPTASTGSYDLAGTSWVLTDLGGAGVVGDTRVTLDFAGNGRATGNGSCNRYFSTVEISGSSIRFGAVGSTRMACATAVSLQEIKYFQALEAANRFTLEGGTLSIYGGESRDPLRFARTTP
jgi:putative lipoprotein